MYYVRADGKYLRSFSLFSYSLHQLVAYTDHVPRLQLHSDSGVSHSILHTEFFINQIKILFWKKLLNCENIAVRTVVAVNRHSIGLIMSKYKLQSISTNVGSINKSIWECFANKAYENGKIQFCRTTS